MPGMFIRAIAIMPPGMFLSQPPATSTPSMHCPLTAVSIASAITSRETSEYFIPSVPMPMPSVTVGNAEHLRHRARLLERGHRAVDERLDAGVARIHRAVAVGDADDRLLEIAVAETDGAQHGAVGRAGDALSDEPGAAVVGHGGTPIGAAAATRGAAGADGGSAYNPTTQF